MMMKSLYATALLLLCSSSPTASESPFFEFSSGVAGYDDAYQLALREIRANIEGDFFIAGAGWTQLWTRDTSYAIELGAGLLFPEISQSSLKKCVQTDSQFGKVWLQDQCGHFGGWPHLSDAIVGVRGAWSLYLTTGDTDFLQWALEITKSSLKRAERDVLDTSSGLFKGCSSFMESNSGYPEKYRQNGRLVGKTKALSTNMLYCSGYSLAAKMAAEVGQDASAYQAKALKLKQAIQTRLWSPQQGYYAYFEDENDQLVPQMEGLGESLALLDFNDDADRVESIFYHTHRTKRGLPCLWPQFNNTIRDIFDYYHNGRIWPFVQGYWAMAAARKHYTEIFADEFSNLQKLSQDTGTFAEYFELDGSFARERSRQLWSDTGFLSMVYHGLFGMVFTSQGIQFDPVKPAGLLANRISLKGVQYRDMVLDLYVSGSGYKIASFAIDGKTSSEPFLPSTLKGSHSVEIVLEGGGGAAWKDAAHATPDAGDEYSLYILFGCLFLLALTKTACMTRFFRKMRGKKAKQRD